EPWRMMTHIKGGVTAAGLEPMEFQYGPDDHRTVRLRGKASVTLGRTPEIDAEFTATQIDLDRVMEFPDAARRRPLMAMKAAVDRFVDAAQFPISLRLNLRVENVTLAGTTLQTVRADIRSEQNAWNIEQLEFRGPGAAQVR